MDEADAINAEVARLKQRGVHAMVVAIHLPNLLFVALAAWQPQSLVFITAAVACEQLGYGFGFAAYLMFMILVADGLEGCDGDAVAIARQLRATNHLTVVDVVGFGVGTKEDTELLRNIAAATGGIYHEAATVAEFDQAFNTLNLSLWRTFDAWLCALSSDPLQACYAKRAEEAIARTEQEIEAMTKRARGEEVVASLKKIKARTEQMRDGRLRVITEYKPRIEELRVTAKRRATAEKSKPKQ